MCPISSFKMRVVDIVLIVCSVTLVVASITSMSFVIWTQQRVNSIPVDTCTSGCKDWVQDMDSCTNGCEEYITDQDFISASGYKSVEAEWYFTFETITTLQYYQMGEVVYLYLFLEQTVENDAQEESDAVILDTDFPSPSNMTTQLISTKICNDTESCTPCVGRVTVGRFAFPVDIIIDWNYLNDPLCAALTNGQIVGTEYPQLITFTRTVPSH